jgi:hypothetical protein
MNRGGFSWKRLTGISAAKSRLSRQIGIPLTRSGRQRKFGAAAGCVTLIVSIAVLVVAALVVAYAAWDSASSAWQNHMISTRIKAPMGYYLPAYWVFP